jgi:hypothetical protein
MAGTDHAPRPAWYLDASKLFCSFVTIAISLYAVLYQTLAIRLPAAHLGSVHSFEMPHFATKTTRRRDERSGMLELDLHHEVGEGIDVRMMQWWYERSSGLEIEYAGQRFPAYQFNHPYDALGVRASREASPGAACKPGAALEFTDSWGWLEHRMHFARRSQAVVWVLGKELEWFVVGYTYEVWGLSMARIKHTFLPTANGTRLHTHVWIGLASNDLRARLFNRWLLPWWFGQRSVEAWCQNMAETFGFQQRFVPPIYAAAIEMDSRAPMLVHLGHPSAPTE